MIPQDRAGAYSRAALAGLLSDLASAGEGERNAALNRAAHRAGRLVAAGAVDGEAAARELEAAALALGLPLPEVTATLRSGLRAGMSNPATVPEGEPAPPRPGPARAPVLPPEPPQGQEPPPRPPRAEVEALWRLARPVTEDREVSTWLAGRAISRGRVELYDLARAIPAGAQLPRWAGCQRVPWSAHHRLVARGWGSTGAAESLHARAVGELPEGLPKGLWPAAGAGSARGLVMADGWGRQILTTGGRPDGWAGELVVAEGLPDWLDVATNYSDSDEAAPAVFGVTAGSWTPEIAARVPEGTRVIIATDPDEAGDKYAQKVGATFQGRDCELRRWRPR